MSEHQGTSLTVEEGNTFACSFPDCGKAFWSKKTLRDHQRIHTGERPYECALWGRKFSQYSSLQKHGRVHDKKKPYKWDHQEWDKSFSQISNLIRHKRIHTGEKPYKWKSWWKEFASSSNLKQHEQTHENSDYRETFRWKFWKKSSKIYFYYSSLRKHIHAAHKEELKKIKSIGTQDEKIKSRKIGAIFLIEIFYRRALNMTERERIISESSSMYVCNLNPGDEKEEDKSGTSSPPINYLDKKAINVREGWVWKSIDSNCRSFENTKNTTLCCSEQPKTVDRKVQSIFEPEAPKIMNGSGQLIVPVSQKIVTSFCPTQSINNDTQKSSINVPEIPKTRMQTGENNNVDLNKNFMIKEEVRINKIWPKSKMNQGGFKNGNEFDFKSGNNKRQLDQDRNLSHNNLKGCSASERSSNEVNSMPQKYFSLLSSIDIGKTKASMNAYHPEFYKTQKIQPIRICYEDELNNLSSPKPISIQERQFQKVEHLDSQEIQTKSLSKWNSGFTVFRDMKPLWRDINRKPSAESMSRESIIKLPCIKTSLSYTIEGGTSKVRLDDFNILKDINASTALWSKLWSRGDTCPELLPVMWDNYRNQKWSWTNIWAKKVNFLKNFT
jgi:hypothetical protein